MGVGPQLVHDLDHARLKQGHPGVSGRGKDRHTAIESGQAGVQNAVHLGQSFETAGGRLGLSLDRLAKALDRLAKALNRLAKTLNHLAEKAGDILNGTVDRDQRRLDGSQPVASVVVH